MDNEVVKKLQAEFLDPVYIVPQTELVYRIDQHGERYYFKLDEYGKPILKASVTSIIKKYTAMSPYLLEWWCSNGYETSLEILKEKSLYGTFAHIMWAKLLLRFNLDMSEAGIKEQLAKFFESENKVFEYDFKEWHKKIKQDLIGFVQWVQDYKIKPIAIEMSLLGEKYSGTVDLVCEIEIGGEKFLAIVDWKSGRNDFYDEYIIQLEGYRQLWNEKFPDKPVETIFSYGCKDFRLPIGKTVTPYRFRDQTNNNIRSRWDYYVPMFNSEHPVLSLESKAEIMDTTINIDSKVTDLIKEVDPLKFLEEENAGNNTGK